MTFLRKFSLVAAALTLALFAQAQDVRAENDLVGKVENIQVTKYELRREMQKILPLNSNYHGGVSAEKKEEIRGLALENLIDQSYMVLYALTQEISVPNSALQEHMKKVRKKFKTTEALQKALGSESVEAYRASIYRILLAKKAEEVAVASKAAMTEEEVLEYYEKNKAMYWRPKQFRASHILVKVDPTLVGEARDELLTKAEELAERAKAGEDFYNLAYYNSDDSTKFVGGDIGYFHLGQAVKPLENAVLAMTPGEIAGPVETIKGFHIIKLVEVNEARQLDFAEAKVKIKETLEKKRYDALYGEWMSDLKSRYKAEIFNL